MKKLREKRPQWYGHEACVDEKSLAKTDVNIKVDGKLSNNDGLVLYVVIRKRCDSTQVRPMTGEIGVTDPFEPTRIQRRTNAEEEESRCGSDLAVSVQLCNYRLARLTKATGQDSSKPQDYLSIGRRVLVDKGATIYYQQVFLTSINLCLLYVTQGRFWIQERRRLSISNSI